ncbi:MAG: hypothetical protein RBS32_08675, partial [Aliarcobacter sp.]|nr:hypothetical protein [Aliarcobacter sp.]
PLEGKLSEDTLKKIKKEYLLFYGKTYLENWEKLHEDSDYLEAVKRNSLISCWHINDLENSDMWCSYTNSSQSIAIKTTVRKLYFSLNIFNSNFNINIKEISYIDFDNTVIEYNSILTPLFFKDKRYSFEKELRVIVWKRPENNILKTQLSNFDVDIGGSLQIDWENLNIDLYVHPHADNSFQEKIKNMLSNNDKFTLHF